MGTLSPRATTTSPSLRPSSHAGGPHCPLPPTLASVTEEPSFNRRQVVRTDARRVVCLDTNLKAITPINAMEAPPTTRDAECNRTTLRTEEYGVTHRRPSDPKTTTLAPRCCWHWSIGSALPNRLCAFQQQCSLRSLSTRCDALAYVHPCRKSLSKGGLSGLTGKISSPWRAYSTRLDVMIKSCANSERVTFPQCTCPQPVFVRVASPHPDLNPPVAFHAEAPTYGLYGFTANYSDTILPLPALVKDYSKCFLSRFRASTLTCCSPLVLAHFLARPRLEGRRCHGPGSGPPRCPT